MPEDRLVRPCVGSTLGYDVQTGTAASKTRCMERQQGGMMHQTSATPREVTADVVEAMRQGRFHLYPITHVDQG